MRALLLVLLAQFAFAAIDKDLVTNLPGTYCGIGNILALSLAC